jgi:tetratricopeptide (TPR) repeat protein
MKWRFLFVGFLALSLVFGLLLMATVNPAAAAADQRTMTTANRLYAAGHYGEAVQLYEGLVAQGVRDGRLLYNLGNAYYQQGNMAQARASYQSAAALAPRDSDLRYNLALVENQAGGAPSSTTAGPLAQLADFSQRWLSIDELASLALGGWLLFGLLVFTYRSFPVGRRPAMLRYAAVLALALVVLAGLPLAASLYAQTTMPAASPGASQTALNYLLQLPLGA